MKSIFYAWQNDLSKHTHRNFIENCLERAIARANKTRSQEDQLVLDKDTQGESGMPDISRVIFDKIDTCAVFVPDLSIVSSAKGRPAPNANVLIELGYALRAIGDRRIVGVFNDASGARSDLPFDLRSRRWPIAFHMTEETPDTEKREIRDKLVATLVEALTAAAARTGSDDKEVPEDRQEGPYDLVGRFPSGRIIAYADASIPGVGADGAIVWRLASHAYLDLRPTPEMSTGTHVALRDRAVTADYSIAAFGPRRAQWYATNSQGIVAGDIVSTPQQPRALCITQLYKHSGALYGVNQAIVAHDGQREYIDGEHLLDDFTDILGNYFEFYRRNPDLPTPLRFYAGFHFFDRAYLKLSTSNGPEFAGPLVDSHVYHSVDALSLETDISELVCPLFAKLWDSAGRQYSK